MDWARIRGGELDSYLNNTIEVLTRLTSMIITQIKLKQCSESSLSACH